MTIMMTLFALTLSFLLLLLLHISTSTAAAPPYTPTEHILLNCGASSDAPSLDGRVWNADTLLSKYLPSNSKTISEPSTASKQDPRITEPVLYMTARIIHSMFTYSFSPLNASTIFLRLYFYSSMYNNTNTNISFFSVKANSYTLLTNFSAFLNIEALNPPSLTLVKEYIINLNDEKNFNLSFLPSTNSFAFVNAIEIVSIPKGLYHRGSNVVLKYVSERKEQPAVYYLQNDQALETMYRVNAGGKTVQPSDDTGMFREWIQDQGYSQSLDYTYERDVSVEYTPTAPIYTAPKIVYTTARYMIDTFSQSYNMTWLFSVDSGFFYLLRLHFCEIFQKITKVDDRIFTIYINGMTAEQEADVIHWGDSQPQVAVFRDYVIYVGANGVGKETKQDLWLAMHPNVDAGSSFASALLNGLEIFKLSIPNNGSLAAPNPPLVISTNEPLPKPLNRKKKSKVWLIAIVFAAVIGASVVAFLIFSWRIRLRKESNKEKSRSKKSSISVGSSLAAVLCRHFTFEEIKGATANFDDNLLIGVGGFGNVYKGYIEDNINGSIEVAIKRLDKSSQQGLHEFLTEIEMLSKLRHLHLVSLIGYCDDNGEMILVYDYMSHGTLHDHLIKTNNHLSWKRRLKICIGAAKGLDYLHIGANHSVIHRDIKSTNILLDEKWVAKVSDFGLSKVGPIGGTKTHVSTAVKGSFGYLDPEYFKRQQLTEKSDVYSFGVVLFEVLCARPAIMHNASKEEVSLAGWVRFCKERGKIDEIVDPKVKGEISPECLHKYIEIGLRCLKVGGIERPTMSDVVWNLEFALQLQEDADDQLSLIEGNEYKEGRPSTMAIVPLLPHGFQATLEDDDADIFSRSMGGSSSCSKSKNTDVFSSNSDTFTSQN